MSERNGSCVCFDLDGTLTDPAEGITRSVAFALNAFGIAVDDLQTLLPFIGPPLADSFRKYYGFSEEEAQRAVETYRIYFRRQGILENRVYPGIPELLRTLKEAGVTVCLVTSKPQEFAERILEHFELSPFFDAVIGPSLQENHLPKAELFGRLLKAHPELSAERTVMVGDRSFDAVAAQAHGIPTVGVLYGYGDRPELEDAGVAALAETVEELQRLLLDRI
jgi:phosphoglycolate phosphatase